MGQIQFNLNDEEDKIVTIVKTIHALNDKKQAIKKIIREYGKNIEVKDKNMK